MILLRGMLTGAVAWVAMDAALRLLRDRERPDVKRREDAAREGVPALERVGETLARSVGVRPTRQQRQRMGEVVQWTVGVAGGVPYALLRQRLRRPSFVAGILYGAAFSIVVDEGLTPALGFAPGPAAFPWQTHARGFAGHLVYGAVAEAASRGLDRFLGPSVRCDTGTEPRRGAGNAH